MRVDSSFEPGIAVAELNIPGDTADRQPNVARTGLEIVFASNRDGGGDIWYASRSSVFEAWSEPVNLSDTVPFSTAAADESRPSFTWDGKSLYYGSGLFLGARVNRRNQGNRALSAMTWCPRELDPLRSLVKSRWPRRS